MNAFGAAVVFLMSARDRNRDLPPPHGKGALPQFDYEFEFDWAAEPAAPGRRIATCDALCTQRRCRSCCHVVKHWGSNT
jgi:hypothetical protein